MTDRRQRILTERDCLYRGVNIEFVFEMAERYLGRHGRQVDSIDPSFYHGRLLRNNVAPQPFPGNTPQDGEKFLPARDNELNTMYFGDLLFSADERAENLNFGLLNAFNGIWKTVAVGNSSPKDNILVPMQLFTSITANGDIIYPCLFSFTGYEIQVR